MGKAQLRPGKAGKGKAQEEEGDFDNSQSDSPLAGLLADQTSLLALFVLVAVIVIIGLMLWVNHSASIQSYVAKHGLQEVISIDSSFDMPSKNSKDKDDLLETYAAVDALERAVQHGNIAGARLILHQLVSSKSVTEENVLALAKLIDDAEAENPIVDIGECVATEAMDLVLEKGGRFVTRDDEGKASKRPGIMMADFDHDKETADGRGRGIASLNVLKEGDFIMEIPPGAMMTALNAQASPTLARVFKEQKQLKPFQQLAVYLLHEAGKKDSVHRKHICSMPLHIPLPFLWQVEDLPADFQADKPTMEGRERVHTLVDESYNATVPLLTETYPDLFPAAQLSPAKWSWAMAIILSRAIPLRKSWSGAVALEDPTQLDADALLAQLRGEKQDGGVYPAIAPVFDMVNHEGSKEMRCPFEVKSDGAIAVHVGPAGLQQGFEVAVTYGEHLCGAMPINRYGFVSPPCPGDEGAAAEGAATEGAAAEGASA